MTLPVPTGRYPVGRVDLHLVDQNRADPYQPASRRELMVSLFYPAAPHGGSEFTPWIPELSGHVLMAANGIPADAVRLPLTHARDTAPYAHDAGRAPVVVYSPGYEEPRAFGTTQAEELASHGYIVAAVDHPGDAVVVEFPDGRAYYGTHPDEAEIPVEIRTADVRFLIDQLTILDRGGNPDAARRRLPAGLCGALDLRRVGIFGHSRGAATAASAMYADPRFKAGVNLDGAVFGPVVAGGLDRPHLLLESAEHEAMKYDETWQQFWPNLRGWRRMYVLEKSRHVSLTDVEVLMPQIAAALGQPPESTEPMLGTIRPDRAVAALRAYVMAFFDLHLRGRHTRLFDGTSDAYPEMRFELR
ncbi:alpha/beta hydrolase family protein [Yinghuangia seranimata]|uniref:alpha/beta hydrolase family protein n=1 Tax=Yinghuangia seranimata TaxID=408067 RepID=UPI003CCF5402